MAVGRAVLQDQGAQSHGIVVEQIGRPHGPGDDHDVVGQGAGPGDRPTAGQVQQHPIRQILEVVEAVAQIGVAETRPPSRHRVVHAPNRRLGRQSSIDGFSDPGDPAAILRKHAVGLQDLLGLAAMGICGLRQQGVDRRVHAAQRPLEPLVLVAGVVGKHLPDRELRAVQHRKAFRDAAVEGDALEAHRQQPAIRRDAGAAGRRVGRVVTPGDDLSHDHRHGLEDLDLVLAEMAPIDVLDDQDAADDAAPQDRHTQQRPERLLPGFRPIGETRVGGGIRCGKRAGVGGDAADQALAEAQPGLMHGGRVEAHGAEQLQHLACPDDVAGADLRPHLDRDQADDLVQGRLGRARPGHDVAQTRQQAPGRYRRRDGGRDRRGGFRVDQGRRRCAMPAPQAPCTARRPGR